jgi:demethylmenaquinone methyltransferase/2-methoxy-6-polyprenyl-1,4-benzoquinol methylase
VTISFGIRNFENLNRALEEIYRVLRSRGRLIVLEFSLPQKRVVRTIYLFYFRKILPIIGTIISGDRSAYRYLNNTVETFPFGDEFEAILSDKGFIATGKVPLTFGIATIYYANKG